MKKKWAWYLVAVLILGLALLAVSCGGATTPTAPTTPTPAPTTPATTTPATPTAPNIPVGHATASCSACHEQGIGGAPKWPDNHASFTEQTCAGCHKSAQ